MENCIHNASATLPIGWSNISSRRSVKIQVLLLQSVKKIQKNKERIGRSEAKARASPHRSKFWKNGFIPPLQDLDSEHLFVKACA